MTERQLTYFAMTTVRVTATAADGPRLLLLAARRLCDAVGPHAALSAADGRLSARLGTGLHAEMFLSTEMRSGAPEASALGLTLRLLADDQTRASVSAEHWAEIWHRQALTEPETDRLAGELPLMSATVERLRHDKPLAGSALLVTGHFLSDLVHLVRCLAELGAPLEHMTVLRKDYAYQWRHRVHGYLEQAGVRVAASTDTEAIHDHTRRGRNAGLRCLALDDGGYVVPALLGAPATAPPWAGVVEQTMSGIYRIQGQEDALPFPVFSVAGSRLKGRIESYWIAEKAVETALSLLPATKIEGQPALVVGYGNVGAQVATLLDQRRMRVAVHNADILHLIDAHENGFVTDRSLCALLSAHRPLIVFGATGRTCLSVPEFRALRRPVYLASVSSRAIEFDLSALQELAVENPASRLMAGPPSRTWRIPGGTDVTVLAEGRPVNFHETDSISNLHSDLVYAGILVGACAVASGQGRPGLDQTWADDVLEASGLLEDYYERYGPPHGLTPSTGP
ncbi:hypothetical protein G3I55_35305 [Streptomyces sp. SID6648]|nr:hypothetical protein [Streptomyces sp. SID6648]